MSILEENSSNKNHDSPANEKSASDEEKENTETAETPKNVNPQNIVITPEMVLNFPTVTKSKCFNLLWGSNVHIFKEFT